jgi:Ion channel
VSESLPDRDEARHILRRLLQALVSTDSYGFVLLLIVVSYALATSVSGRFGPTTVLSVQIVTVWFALRTSGARPPVRYAAFVLMAYGIIAAVIGTIVGENSQQAWLFLASGLLYLIAPFSIVRHLAERPRVDQETMLGAVAAYLLIGMTFAFAYLTIGSLQSGPFFGMAGEGTTSQTLFFSFTTLTTTGYGNLVPAQNPGQTLAVFEMIIGQLFLITALGKVVSAWRPPRWAAREDPEHRI